MQKMIVKGESERLEFKRSTGQRTDAAKAVCAMLNGLGGFVIFGVSDRGELIGQQLSHKTLEDIANELKRIEPPIFPDIETTTLKNGKSIILLRVSGGGGPYAYDGRPYLRRGPTTQLLPKQRYEQLLLEKMHASARWENQPAHGFTLAGLDKSEISRTIDEAIRRERLEEPGTRSALELLRGLGLLDEQKRILNAAIVLFAKSNRLLPDYPQCLLKMSRFRGTDKTEFIDNRQEYGNAFNLFQRAQRFLRDHLPVAGKIVPGIYERIDEPMYPTAALREAIANALCHRDYTIPGGSVNLAIYDDRLEISNTGVLPFDLKPTDLFKPHASRPWNPLIAQAFYRRGIIEAWGRGIIKMRDLTIAAGLPEPEYYCNRSEVLICFRPAKGMMHKKPDESQLESQLESETLRTKVINLLIQEKQLSKAEIAARLKQKQVSGQLHKIIRDLIKEGAIAYTIPAKPNSRLQRYYLKQ